MTQKRRLLYWEGSSKKDFKEFPIDVLKAVLARYGASGRT